MKYLKKNFDVVSFGTFSGTFGEKIKSVAQSVFIWQPFENNPAFWQLYFINHVKNSKSSPTSKIFSHLEDIMPTNNLYY